MTIADSSGISFTALYTGAVWHRYGLSDMATKKAARLLASGHLDDHQPTEHFSACGVRLQPLANALRNTLLDHRVLHADETPVSMLPPGKKKTRNAYV